MLRTQISIAACIACSSALAQAQEISIKPLSSAKQLAIAKAGELSTLQTPLEAIALPVTPEATERANEILPITPMWTLAEGKTIQQNLKAWSEKTEPKWNVVWNLDKDWVVPAPASFSGDFADATQAVIKTLASNGALIRVTVYDGNRTVLVFGPGVSQK